MSKRSVKFHKPQLMDIGGSGTAENSAGINSPLEKLTYAVQICKLFASYS